MTLISAGIRPPVAPWIYREWFSPRHQRPFGTDSQSSRPTRRKLSVRTRTALEHELTVVTRNVKDFAGLGVEVLNPWSD
jgi:hypothetical protein